MPSSTEKNSDPATHVYLKRFNIELINKGIGVQDDVPQAFRVALCPCSDEGSDPIWEVALDDTGSWSIECLECGEAILFKDLMEKFK